MRTWLLRGLVTSALAAGCGPGATSDAGIADGHVRLTLALAEHDPESLDAYLGLWRPAVRERSLAVLEARATALSESATGAVGGRAHRLAGELRALAARARALRGERVSFDESLRVGQGMEPPPRRTREDARAVHRDLGAILPGEGEVPERLVRFERRYVVPPDRLARAAESALRACRTIALAKFTLPSGESVALEFPRGRPWAARQRYLGDFRSVVALDAEAVWTVPALLETVCHESYAGHHLLIVLAHHALVRSRGLAEHRVLHLFGPRGALAERLSNGVAALARRELAGTELEAEVYRQAGLDPALAGARRELDDRRAALRPFLVEGARRYVDGELDRVGAAIWLEEVALVADAWSFLRFVDRYGSYVAAYASDDTISTWEVLEARWLTDEID